MVISSRLDIADKLQSLNISDPNCLAYCPGGDKVWLQEKFDNCPRYLFRVFTPKSCGTTNKCWTKSMDARDADKQHTVDIFQRGDNGRVARMLNCHLRWWEGLEDNFVSWTSSLLFALIYIFHLHANARDRSTFEDISLCVIDTTKFPQAVFLRDIDLIEAYSPFDRALEDFKGLRSRADMYFGEYLSQISQSYNVVRSACKCKDDCQDGGRRTKNGEFILVINAGAEPSRLQILGKLL